MATAQQTHSPCSSVWKCEETHSYSFSFLLCFRRGSLLSTGKGNKMKNLKLFAVAIALASLTGCISIGSKEPNPKARPAPKGSRRHRKGDRCSRKAVLKVLKTFSSSPARAGCHSCPHRLPPCHSACLVAIKQPAAFQVRKINHPPDSLIVAQVRKCLVHPGIPELSIFIGTHNAANEGITSHYALTSLLQAISICTSPIPR